jgi:4-amino-4-deoxy-L-arabinose transferase-like glycosyltransferase
MFRKPLLILLGILLLGLLIRVYRIQSLPMYGDELTLVYDTYSVLKTGQDQTGTKLPVTFAMRGRSPGGYVYFSLPFVAALGPSILGVRLLSLVSGLGIIILLYFLGKILFGQKVGLLASFIAAISPWEIYLSRGGFETHFALFLALLGLVSFLYAQKTKWLYALWAVSWGLAMHTYPTFKLTLPLMFFALVWFTGLKKLLKEKLFIVGLIILLFLGGVLVKENLTSNSEQRFLNMNIFADRDLKERIIQGVNIERTISTLPEPLKPLSINRPIEYGRILLENYVKNISPNFLILRGDGNPRHNPGEMGMLYLVDLPLILIASMFLWQQKKRELILLTSWILITPLATMFFPEAHALRNDLMLPPLLLLSTFALTKIPRLLFYFVLFLILIQLTYILVRVYTIAPAKFASFWSAEAQKVSFDAIQSAASGRSVVLSTKEIDNIEYAYPVYAKIDPKLVIAQYGKFPKVYGNVSITDK